MHVTYVNYSDPPYLIRQSLQSNFIFLCKNLKSYVHIDEIQMKQHQSPIPTHTCQRQNQPIPQQTKPKPLTNKTPVWNTCVFFK